MEEFKEKVGQLRLLKSGSKVWSISNQANIKLTEDSIVKIKHTCYGNDGVFAEPMQLLFNLPGYIPTIIGKGRDEWSFLFEDSIPYEIPSPQFEMKYGNHE